MHDFWLRRGKTLRYNAIKLRILTLKQGEKKLRIFAEMNLKVLVIGWMKFLPGPLRTACAHVGAFGFIKRKSLKLLGSSRSFRLCCALPQRIRASSRRSHSAGSERICKNRLDSIVGIDYHKIRAGTCRGDAFFHSVPNCTITAPISALIQTACRSISGGQTACP